MLQDCNKKLYLLMKYKRINDDFTFGQYMNNTLINIDNINNRLKNAYSASRLSAKRPEILGASKGQGTDKIRAAYAQGLRMFGENRVQEAIAKWPPLKTEMPDVTLHLIGPLQTNKIREAVALFDVIQTIDRPKLAEALAKEMSKQNRSIACFIQINTGKEPQKAGITPEEADDFIGYCRNTLKLPVAGLMCIPPSQENPALHFALLHEIGKRNGLNELSMGMSEDFETAIRFGATIIRLGRALFGERD